MFLLRWSLRLLLTLVYLSLSSMACDANSSHLAAVIDKTGVFLSPEGKCEATIRVSEMGGFRSLIVQDNSSKISSNEIKDITGIAWLNNEELIYSVSPIYGQPGIFLLNCSSPKSITRIAGPTTIDKAYPNGADYFELKSLSNRTDVKVLFYYAPDVDRVDFNHFRTSKYLYQVNLDGTEFKKAQ